MISLRDLGVRAHSVSDIDASGVGTIRLDAEQDVPGLLIYFAQDPLRDRIRLVIKGDEVGYLDRADVYKMFPTRTKGLGDAGGFQIPGEPSVSSYRVFELHCPVHGCPDSPIYTMALDEHDPPTCRLHPDQRLRLQG